MFGTYRVGSDQTNIVVEGYSGSNYATFNLRFPGKALGTYKFTIDNTVNVEVNTGTGVKENNIAGKMLQEGIWLLMLQNMTLLVDI